MNVLQHKYKLLFGFVLYVTVIIIYIHFPSLNRYFYQADEGTYYRQAVSINQRGFAAFSELTEAYKKNEHQEQLFPNPLRVGHILMAAVALYLHDSITSLSYLSVIFFVLLCIAVFIYLRWWYGERIAAMAACLVCVSPLLCGLSARALSDLDSCFFHTLTLLTFIHYIKLPGNKRFACFVSAFTISILVKETGSFFLPFYFLVMLYASHYRDTAIARWHIYASVLLPVLFSGIVILMVVGMPSIIAIVEVIIRNNVAAHTLIPFVVRYNSGPWYLYIIDYLLLSPLTALLFMFFLGHYLMQAKKQFIVSVTVLYAAYFMVCYNFLPKNVRYALPLDVVIRVCSVLYLSSFIEKIMVSVLAKRLMCYAVFIIIAAYDYFNYYKFFVTNSIYDPVSYELLRAEKIVPLD